MSSDKLQFESLFGGRLHRAGHGSHVYFIHAQSDGGASWNYGNIGKAHDCSSFEVARGQCNDDLRRRLGGRVVDERKDTPTAVDASTGEGGSE